MRDNLDTHFMKIATLVSERSTCIKQQVGAVLVKGKHIIATGYNGAPAGLPHCTEETCLRKGLSSLEDSHLCRGVHAEQNTIIQSALHGASSDGATIYTTHFPCMSCLKMLINAGIREIVYLTPYDMGNEIKMELVRNAGVRMRQLSAQ